MNMFLEKKPLNFIKITVNILNPQIRRKICTALPGKYELIYSAWIENASVFGSWETQFYNTLLAPNFLSEFQLWNFYFSVYNAQVEDSLSVEYAE